MIKYLLVILSSLFISLNVYSSDTVRKIIISGNDRISNEKIKMFSEIDVNSKIDNNIISNAPKITFTCLLFS